MNESSLPDHLCHLDGHVGPLSQARVSVLDRGFIFGDGIYEVIPVYGRRLFRLDEHLARLGRSLAKLRIPNPHDREGWLACIRPLVQSMADSGGSQDQLVYIQVTRGVAARDHVMPQGLRPTVFIMTNPMKPPSEQQRREGVACVTARDFRWERGDIKSVSLLGNVLARQISADAGAVETLMFRDGLLTEASSSNVWVVRDGTLLGVPRSPHVLEGIRYELLRELCESCGVPHELRPVRESEVWTADEVMLSSATKEVLPVTRIDGEPVGRGAGRGRPGPVYQRVYDAYQRAKAEQSI